MALSGLEIFKLLPKTNCKKCGRPTCLAFAMQLAQKKANLDECPDISPEAKAALAGASAPPMRKITFGTGDQAFAIGEETALYRHESKFCNPAGVAITLGDDLDEAAFQARLQKINALKFVRVGTTISVNLVALLNRTRDPARFAAAAAKLASGTHLNLMLVSDSADALKAALAHCAARKPLLHAATPANAEAVLPLAKTNQCPLAVKADSLEALADLTEKIKSAGFEDMILDLTADGLLPTLTNLTISRRAALKKNFRPLGYPTIVFATAEDPWDQVADAATYVAKYAGIVVTDVVEPWQVMPILTVRQNIYTDPQKPIQVEPKLYAIREPNENSPVMFTTNFSLTYYSVESDVEASRIPAYILAVDTEGTSVLTAYSGDKLNEQVVAKAMAAAKLDQVVKHRKLIIPGHVAVMSGKLEEVTGWEILVGPKESAQIPAFLKQVWVEKAGK